MIKARRTSEAELRQLAAQGLRQREIAAAVGMTPGYVNKLFQRYGIRGRESRCSEAVLRNMAGQGLMRRQIAELLGVTLSCINQVMTKYGIRTHGRPGSRGPKVRPVVKSEFPARALPGTAANPFGLGTQ